MPKPEREFFDVETIPWRPVPGAPGLCERVLSRDAETGDYTRLFRIGPGADTSPLGVQAHDFWEEVYIVEGEVHDLTLDTTFGAGMYACRPPGMRHGPWRSVRGCTMFEIRYRRAPQGDCAEKPERNELTRARKLAADEAAGGSLAVKRETARSGT